MFDSKRDLLYIVRNSPNYSNARKYIESICDIHKIKNYEFKEYIDDKIALFVTIGDKQYILYLDYNTIDLKVSVNGKIIKAFTKDVAWSNAIEYLSKTA